MITERSQLKKLPTSKLYFWVSQMVMALGTSGNF